jgi:hypothetical protein
VGACTFSVRRHGRTADEAFKSAVAEALHEYGHRGGTGTIAEKDGFRMIPCPAGQAPAALANQLIRAGDPRVDDKWGPAGCIDCGPVEGATDTREYLFFGWAPE